MPNTDIRDIDTQIPNTDILISEMIYDLEPMVHTHCKKILDDYDRKKAEKDAAEAQKKANKNNAKINPDASKKTMLEVKEMLDSMGLTVDDIRKLCPDNSEKSTNELQRILMNEHSDIVTSSGLHLSILCALIKRGELDSLREV